MNYIIIFFLSLLLSLLMVPVVRRIAIKYGFVNKPKEDRWKNQPVALMGGVAIFLSFLVTTLLMTELQKEIIVLLLGGLVIFILGFLDDIFGTYPVTKFTVQVAVALVLIGFGIVSKIMPYIWLDVPLTILWIVGLTNALNLLDNMDGLSSGIAIISALGIFGLSLINGQTMPALMCIALIGGCLGFLRYNFNPAKIFMGDCGSLFIGYMLASLVILSGWQHSSYITLKLLSSVLLLGVPIFDTTLVTILRLAHKRMPWQGGRDHCSHRLVKIFNGNEKYAVLSLYGVGILSSSLGIIVAMLDSLVSIIIAVCFFAGMTILGIKLSKVECYSDNLDIILDQSST